MKRILAGAAVAVVLTGGAAVARAADSDEAPAPSTEAGSCPAAETGPATSAEQRQRGLRRYRRAALEVAARTIGIEPQELREAIRGGTPAAEVASANGVEPQAVADALVAAATERIDAAVAAGELDSERAARMRSRLPELALRALAFVPRSASTEAAAP